MRWLIVTPFDRPGDMGVDVLDELRALGHEARTFAYRRNNPFYRNRGTKAAYQLWVLRRLERVCVGWRPDVVLVIKGGPITPGLIRRVKARLDCLFVNIFPDNPLLMMPLECIEAYDLFFTKERYAIRELSLIGLENIHYLAPYCVPALHHPVRVPEEEARRWRAPIAFVGTHYPFRERFFRVLAGYPVRIWGRGWERCEAPEVTAMVAGGTVTGLPRLAIYSEALLSLNLHHPLNDIAGVNVRVFELAACGACQVTDMREGLDGLFRPGDEILAYRDPDELRRQLDYHLAHPDEARAIGDNALKRALAEHTLRHRIDEMLDVIEQRFGRR